MCTKMRVEDVRQLPAADQWCPSNSALQPSSLSPHLPCSLLRQLHEKHCSVQSVCTKRTLMKDFCTSHTGPHMSFAFDQNSQCT